MGILDDAIKEHLELKRSHGASDDEIRRQEAEVFGAARAEAEAAAPAAEEHTQLLTPDSDLEHEDLQPAPEDPYVVHPGDDLVPDPDVPDPDATQEHPAPFQDHQDEQQPGPSHDHHDEQHPALVDHDHIGGEEHPPEPVFRHAAEVPTAPPPVEEPPVVEPPIEPPPVEEPPVEEPPVEEPPVEGEDEDVLEETPEFLQDAPEHDRLWFEQKPPRDFDFGE
jgi:hypothetical protein